MRTHRSTVLLGVLAAGGLMLTQQACTPTGQPLAQPVSFTPPTETAAADPILTGQRQVVIKPVPGFESIVAVDNQGRLGLTDGAAEHSLFVLSPIGGRYQIKTAGSCLGIRNNGSAPLTVEAAPCDPGRAGQLFTIKPHNQSYAISNESAYLQVFPSGLIAEELGDAPLQTTFTFVDNGPA